MHNNADDSESFLHTLNPRWSCAPTHFSDPLSFPESSPSAFISFPRLDSTHKTIHSTLFFPSLAYFAWCDVLQFHLCPWKMTWFNSSLWINKCPLHIYHTFLLIYQAHDWLCIMHGCHKWCCKNWWLYMCISIICWHWSLLRYMQEWHCQITWWFQFCLFRVGTLWSTLASRVLSPGTHDFKVVWPHRISCHQHPHSQNQEARRTDIVKVWLRFNFLNLNQPFYQPRSHDSVRWTSLMSVEGFSFTDISSHYNVFKTSLIFSYKIFMLCDIPAVHRKLEKCIFSSLGHHQNGWEKIIPLIQCVFFHVLWLRPYSWNGVPDFS